MKRSLFSLLTIIICMITIVSCSKDDILTNEDEIQLDDITLNFNKSAHSELIEIPIKDKSNTWHIYSPSKDAWVTQEVIPGRSSLYVYVDGNTTSEPRSSYILIHSKNYTQKIIINQDFQGGIEVNQSYVPLRYFAASSTVEITNYSDLTDISTSLNNEAQSWLTITHQNENIYVNATLNELSSAREGILTIQAKRRISGEPVTAYINVYQGKGGMKPYIIDIPDFSESLVYKVMDGNKQVAQITKEYLRSVNKINAQAIVIYPVENDIVYLNKGYVAQIVLENSDLSDATYTFASPTKSIHGGTVSFNIADNSISGYVAGTQAEAVTRVYMPGDVGMGPEVIPSSVQTTVIPHVITDIRNTETNIYPIVKIGAQYWMGKNLNTIFYRNGTSIPTNQSDRTKQNYAIYNFANGQSDDPLALINRQRYGILYSFMTIGGFDTAEQAGITKANDVIEDKLSPTGWNVPSENDRDNLARYIKKYERLRNFKTYSNNTDIIGTPNLIAVDDNITGFNAINGSYRATGGGWESLTSNNAARWWTNTVASLTTMKAFSVTQALSGEDLKRMLNIRSINKTEIKISDQ